MPNKRALIGIAFSVILIYLILWKPQILDLLKGGVSLRDGLFGFPRVDFGSIWQYLKQTKPLPIVLYALITPLHVLLRAHRWMLMLEPVGKVKLADSYSLQMIGYFANTVLPFRIGELLRAMALGKKLNLSKSSALATVVLERVLDVFSLLVITVIVTLANTLIFGVIDDLSGTVGSSILVIGVGALLLVAFILSFALAPNPLDGAVGILLSLTPGRFRGRFESVILQFWEGFGMLKSSRHYTLVSLETLLLWGLYVTQVYFALVAFGFTRDYPLIAGAPILASFVILIVSAIGLSVPSAPAGVGAFHAACILGLSLLGVTNTDSALGFAIVLHILTAGYFVIGGTAFMWREGMHFSDLRKARMSS